MKKILVVDDSPVVRSFHSNILKVEGFAADVAGDGIEAIEKSLSKAYDLILSDINMPRMDGLTMIQELRQEHRQDLPIIVLTTQEEDIHRTKAYIKGANLYLVKPVKPEQLVQHIKLLLGVPHEND